MIRETQFHTVIHWAILWNTRLNPVSEAVIISSNCVTRELISVPAFLIMDSIIDCLLSYSEIIRHARIFRWIRSYMISQCRNPISPAWKRVCGVVDRRVMRWVNLVCLTVLMLYHNIPDNKVHGANIGPIWGRKDPGGPHVGPMNLAIWDVLLDLNSQ